MHLEQTSSPPELSAVVPGDFDEPDPYNTWDLPQWSCRDFVCGVVVRTSPPRCKIAESASPSPWAFSFTPVFVHSHVVVNKVCVTYFIPLFNISFPSSTWED